MLFHNDIKWNDVNKLVLNSISAQCLISIFNYIIIKSLILIKYMFNKEGKVFNLNQRYLKLNLAEYKIQNLKSETKIR